MQTFDRSAPFYDAIYAARGKSYRTEATQLRALIEDRGIPYGSTLLDVACGTGEHLSFLEPYYEVTGVDASPAMLRVARKKLPRVTFHEKNMSCFSLDSSFEIITCLFSAIGYLPDQDELVAAIRHMAEHLRPGGLLVVEPALGSDNVAPAVTSKMSLDAVVEGRPVSVTRTTSAIRQSSVLRIRFDYEVALSEEIGKTYRLVEYHPILLVSPRVYTRAFEKAGLGAEYLEPGISGIGLYLASKTSRASSR